MGCLLFSDLSKYSPQSIGTRAACAYRKYACSVQMKTARLRWYVISNDNNQWSLLYAFHRESHVSHTRTCCNAHSDGQRAITLRKHTRQIKWIVVFPLLFNDNVYERVTYTQAHKLLLVIYLLFSLSAVNSFAVLLVCASGTECNET